MSAPPYMKLYWADYHQDTRHLTRDEHGAYFLLLGEAWNRGGYLPDDDDLLARWTISTPEEWARLKPVVMAFFRQAKGRWKQKRIGEELATYSEVSRKRKSAGKRGGASSRGKDTENSQANAKLLPTKPEPEPEPEPEPVDIGGGVERAGAVGDWPEGRDVLTVAVAQTGSPWLDPNKSPGLITSAGRFAAWRRAGASFSEDVIPALIAVCHRQREPIQSWAFFDNAVARAQANRERDLTPAEARPANVVSLPDRIAAEHDAAKDLARQRLETMGIAWDG